MSYRISSMIFKKHAHALADLLKENFPNYSDERFQWLYQEYPHGPPETILAESKKTSKIIGSGSLIERYFSFDSTKFIAGIAVDFNVSKKYRVFGPAIILQKSIVKIIEDSEIDFILGTPNPAARGVFAKIGYKKLGEPQKYSKILRSWPKINHYINIPLLAKILGGVLDRVLWLTDIVKSFPKPKGIDVEVLSECDERFNRLWEEGNSFYHIIGERSADYLNWRFLKHNESNNKIFCIKNKIDNSLKGYIIFNVKGNIATIVDLFAVNEKKNVIYLLYAFSCLMRKENVLSIQVSFLGYASFVNFLKRAMFIERGVSDRVCMLFIGENVSEARKTQLLNSNNWFLFDDDMDL